MRTILIAGMLAGAILTLALPTNAQDSQSNEFSQNSSVIIMLQSTSDTISTEELSKELRRVCIVCEDKYYCITNGCANTPCGWICSE